MFNFDFSNPARILFGQGRIAALATPVSASGARAALVRWRQHQMVQLGEQRDVTPAVCRQVLEMSL